jgi:hypothetical protein
VLTHRLPSHCNDSASTPAHGQHPAGSEPSPLARIVHAAAHLLDVCIISTETLKSLEREFGGLDAAGDFVTSVVLEIDHPIVIHSKRSGILMFVAPRGWLPARTSAWVEQHRETITRDIGTSSFCMEAAQ